MCTTLSTLVEVYPWETLSQHNFLLGLEFFKKVCAKTNWFDSTRLDIYSLRTTFSSWFGLKKVSVETNWFDPLGFLLVEVYPWHLTNIFLCTLDKDVTVIWNNTVVNFKVARYTGPQKMFNPLQPGPQSN